MLSIEPNSEIAPKEVDEVSIATEELHNHLEEFVSSVAPEPDFSFIHQAHGDFVVEAAREINQGQIEKLQWELNQGRLLVEAKERLTRRGEFSGFRNSLSLKIADARKCMNFAATFGDWAIDKLVVIASATNIFTLCQKKYAEVVEQLRSAGAITKEFVQRLVKEVRGRAAAERKKNKEEAQAGSSSGEGVLKQHIDVDGTTYFSLKEVNLSEKTGSKLAELLKIQSIAQIIAQALEASLYKEKIEELQQELVDAVNEMRDRHIEMERQLIERSCTIEELRNALAAATAVKENENQVVVNETRLNNAEQEGLAVGDRVTHVDKYTVMSTYLGVVEAIFSDEVLVRWSEWKGRPKECERYYVAELRKIA